MDRDSDNLEDGFVQLVSSHQMALHAFVVSMMPGSPEADDVVQKANQVIWQKRRNFKIGTSFKAWMFSVARYEVLAAVRDQKRRKEWTVPESVLTKLLEEGQESSDEKIVPRHEILHECLNQLRPDDRTLIMKRYFERRKATELADAAARSADSVRVSLRRIRLALGMCVRRRMKTSEVMS